MRLREFHQGQRAGWGVMILAAFSLCGCVPGQTTDSGPSNGSSPGVVSSPGKSGGSALDDGMLVACKSNLKNIGTAYEMYATDNAGQFPTSMDALTPNYLKTIPECVSARKVSYKVSVGPDAPGNTRKMENYYLVECHGENHTKAGITGNYPTYDTIRGLTTASESSLDPAESAIRQQQEYNQLLISQISELPSLREKGAALLETHRELLAAQGQKMSKEEHSKMVGKETGKLEPATPPQLPSDVPPAGLSESQKAEFVRLSEENKQIATQWPLLAEVQNRSKWLEEDIARLQKVKPGK